MCVSKSPRASLHLLRKTPWVQYIWVQTTAGTSTCVYGEQLHYRPVNLCTGSDYATLALMCLSNHIERCKKKKEMLIYPLLR